MRRIISLFLPLVLCWDGGGFSTSKQMMSEKVGRIYPEKQDEEGVRENRNPPDVVTLMYLLHEVPQLARRRIIKNAQRTANKKVIVVDISPDYIPSASMIAGTPHLLDYLSNIREDLCFFEEKIIIPNRVHCWVWEGKRESTR